MFITIQITVNEFRERIITILLGKISLFFFEKILSNNDNNNSYLISKNSLNIFCFKPEKFVHVLN